MKKVIHVFFTLLGLLSIPIIGIGQTEFFNRGAMIIMLDSTELFIDGDFRSAKGNLNTQFTNGGTVVITGDIINEDENGIFGADATAGKVVFAGSENQSISGDSAIVFFDIEINKPDSDVVVMNDIQLKNTLTLTSGNLELRGGAMDMLYGGMLINEREDARVFGTKNILVESLGGINDTIRSLGIDMWAGDSAYTGSFKLERGHIAQTAGDGGINRYYTLKPNVYAIPIVEFSYFDAELNGLDESKLEFWFKNGSADWRRRYVSADTTNNTLLDTFDVSVVSTNLLVITASEGECANPTKPDLGNDTIYMCGGASIELDLEFPSYEYLWDDDSKAQTRVITTEGTYWGAIISSNGCVGYDTVVVINMAAPVAAFDIPVGEFICIGDTLFASGDSTEIDSGYVSYHWDFGIDTSSSDTLATKNVGFVYPGDDSYDVRLTVTSDFGCKDSTDLASVLVHPLPQVSFAYTEVCLNEITEFKSTTPGGVSKSTWDFGDGTSDIKFGTDSTTTKGYSNSTDYEVTLTILGSNSCIDSITQTVPVHALPVANFIATKNCENESTAFTNTSAGASTYQWDFANGQTSTQTSPAHLFGSADDYNVELIAQSGDGCVDTIVQLVMVDTVPVPDFSFSDVCDEQTMDFFNTSTMKAGTMSYLWNFDNGNVSTSYDASELYNTPQNYSVKLFASSSNGCSDSIVKVVTVHPKPVAQFVASNECVGDNISFNNFSSILSGSLSASWDFGDGSTSSVESPSYSYSADTVYTVQLISNSDQGCKDTMEVSVEAFALPVLDFGDTVATCAAQNAFDAENVGSTYLWSDNSIAQTFTAYADGTYTVTVTTAENCVSIEKVVVLLNTINDPGLPDTDVACDLVSYNVYLYAANYIWTDGSTNSIIDATTSGEYGVTVTDQNNCKSYDSVNVTVNTSPVVDLGNDIDACEGDSFLLDGANTGSNYAWSDGTVGQTIAVSSNGQYAVTVSDANGCQGKDSINAVFNALPVINISSTEEVCDEAILDAENVGSNYLWSTGATTQTILVNTSGTYSIEVTDANSCSSTMDFTVNVNPVPVVSLGGDVILCNGETQAYDVTQTGMTYLWSDAKTNADNYFGTGGTVWVEITNSLGCSARDSATITVDGPIDLDLGLDRVLCSSNGYNLDAGVAASYTWSWDGINVGSDRYNRATEAGKYWVDVVSALGCSESDTILIGATSPVFFADFLVATTISVGEAVQFVQVSEPEAISQLWVFGDGSTSSDQHPEYTYYIDGDYDVMLIASNDNCTDTIIKPISVMPLQIDPIVWQENPVEDIAILNANLYPNPTYGQFNLDVVLNKESDIILTVYDLNGQILGNERHVATEEVDDNFVSETMHNYSELSSGLYFVGITAKHKMKVVRFIKQN